MSERYSSADRPDRGKEEWRYVTQRKIVEHIRVAGERGWDVWKR
jgi:hypothetical protein